MLIDKYKFKTKVPTIKIKELKEKKIKLGVYISLGVKGSLVRKMETKSYNGKIKYQMKLENNETKKPLNGKRQLNQIKRAITNWEKHLPHVHKKVTDTLKI